MSDKSYFTPYESLYCSPPEANLQPKLLILGSGVGLYAAEYFCQICPALASDVVVADLGGLDILTHIGNTDFPRFPLLRQGAPHFGGKLSLWGNSAPRPSGDVLARFPYPADDLARRFSQLERELGIDEPSPFSEGSLHSCVLERLAHAFSDFCIRPAPLAIDRFGRRWSPLGKIPDLAARGVKLLARFRCLGLEAAAQRVAAVRGRWLVDDQEYVIKPLVTVLALGVEHTLPFVRRLCKHALPVEAADHIRIDLHGSLPPGSFGSRDVEALGVAILLLEGLGRCGAPFHLEIKIAPQQLWRRFMPSGDNLRGGDTGDTIYVQVQAIAAMHDRLPVKDLLNIGADTEIPPVMSCRDASFHNELVALMTSVANALGLASPTFSFRPLLTNHHIYGAFRVGKAVSREFMFSGFENLYILPPTSYVDVDDDANPTLKSLVLSQYAMDAIAARLRAP